MNEQLALPEDTVTLQNIYRGLLMDTSNAPSVINVKEYILTRLEKKLAEIGCCSLDRATGNIYETSESIMARIKARPDTEDLDAKHMRTVERIRDFERREDEEYLRAAEEIQMPDDEEKMQEVKSLHKQYLDLLKDPKLLLRDRQIEKFRIFSELKSKAKEIGLSVNERGRLSRRGGRRKRKTRRTRCKRRRPKQSRKK